MGHRRVLGVSGMAWSMDGVGYARRFHLGMVGWWEIHRGPELRNRYLGGSSGVFHTLDILRLGYTGPVRIMGKAGRGSGLSIVESALGRVL